MAEINKTKMSWQPEMVRVIFDVIDENKGPHSISITNFQEALEQVRQRLDAVTEDRQVYAVIKHDKINNKLQKQLQKAGCSWSRAREIFTHGTAIIDLSKLSEGAYSKEEVNQSRNAKGSVIERLRAADRKRKAGHLDVEEEEFKEKNNVHGSKARAQATHLNTSGPAFINQSTRYRHQSEDRIQPAVTVDLAHHAVQQEKTQHRQALTTEPLSQQQPTQVETFRCDFCAQYFPHKELLDYHKIKHFEQFLPYNTFKCSVEGCRAYFALADDLNRHAVLHVPIDQSQERHVPEVRGFSHESSEEGDTIQVAAPAPDNRTPGETEIINFMARNETAPPLDLDHIRTEMRDMQNKIYSHVLDLFRDLQCDTNAPPRTICKESTTSLGLLRSLFGARIHEPNSMQFHQVASNDYLQVSELVLALTGAAVTNWALDPLPSTAVTDGLFTRYTKIVSERSKSLHDHILELATVAYLEETVKPEIPLIAIHMSAELMRVLRPLLDSLRTRGIARPSSGVIANVDTLRDSIASSVVEAEHNLLPFYPVRIDPYNQFTTRMKDIFGQALKLRISMELSGHAKFNFFLPVEGAKFDFQKHTPRDKSSNQELAKMELCKEDGFAYDEQEDGRSPVRTVKVALFPALNASVKHTRDGPWRDSVLLFKGDVLIWRKAHSAHLEQDEIDDSDDLN